MALSSATVYLTNLNVSYTSISSSATTINRINVLFPKREESPQPHMTLEPYTASVVFTGATPGAGQVQVGVGDMWAQWNSAAEDTASLYFYDGSTISILGGGTAGIVGGGTINRIPKFTATTTLGNSNLVDDGTDIYPNGGTPTLGKSTNKWSDFFATQTTIGAIFESELKTEGIGILPTGTVLVWRRGMLIPCDRDEDWMVIGVAKHGKDEPIIMGAEPILVTGHVNEGDFIVTSTKHGHGKAVTYQYLLERGLFGKIIAQALEAGDGESHVIKAMIRKL